MIALYSLALLVSAALLFLLEPMVAKFVLPLLGSAPEVWPTTVLFFQAALLAGYGFAHATSRLSPRRQALLQLGLLGNRRGRPADRRSPMRPAGRRQPRAVAAEACSRPRRDCRSSRWRRTGRWCSAG